MRKLSEGPQLKLITRAREELTAFLFFGMRGRLEMVMNG